jgi:hypothetical protein
MRSWDHVLAFGCQRLDALVTKRIVVDGDLMRAAPQRANGKKGAKVECTLIRVVPVGGGRGGRVLTSVCVETKDAKKIYDAVDLLGLDSFEAGSRWAAASGDASRADDWMGRSVIGYPEICSRIASGK